MATKKKAASPRSKKPQLYVAVQAEAPPQELRKAVDWLRLKCPAPQFHKIEILNDQVTSATWWCYARRGFFFCPTDRVCWVNQDGKNHTIKFVGGRWPFQESQPAAGISVLSYGTTGWFTLKREAMGGSIRYDYYVDTPGGPDGPAIWSED